MFDSVSGKCTSPNPSTCRVHGHRQPPPSPAVRKAPQVSGSPEQGARPDDFAYLADAYIKFEAHKDPAETTVSRLVPRTGGWGEYYTATETKHFGDRTQPGSKFLDPKLKTLEDVLLLAQKQRGSLEGDDRDLFIAEGASPESFNPNFRYLKIRTPGTMGVEHSVGLPDTTMVEVVRTKPGGPCSVVHDVVTQPRTDTGVIVLARDTSGAVPEGGDILITAFPGAVVPPSTSELDMFEGQHVSLGQVRAIAGDVWMNTRVHPSQPGD